MLKSSFTQAFSFILLFSLALSQSGCSSSSKKGEIEEVDLAEFQGRKIALVEVQGPPISQQIVEVALVNQLIQHGSFQLISKQEVSRARGSVGVDSSNPQMIAAFAGADVSLQIDVKKFDATEKSGFSKQEEIDDQLAEERGSGETERVYRVKELRGGVEFELLFTDLSSQKKWQGTASSQKSVQADDRKSAIHLPPKLRFLEEISNKAFQDFFDRYN